MKITPEEINEEIKNSTKEQDILRRVFALIAYSVWEDEKLISNYCKSFNMSRSLGKDINAVVQKNFPKWYTKQVKLHKANKNNTNES